MSGLKEKYDNYEKICGYTMHYEFDSGFVLDFSFSKTAFPHLVGLHKLVDIPDLDQFADKRIAAKVIINKIKRGYLTESLIRGSAFFSDIEKRYGEFTLENLFNMSYTDVIVNFDKTLLTQTKLQNTKFILFEEDSPGCYRQLCLGGDSTNGYYPESFFYQPNDYYLVGQDHQSIHKVQILKPDGSVYFEDTF